MLAACASGLIAGTVHVVAGPDHLAAVAPLAAERTGRGWVCGLAWGMGHSLGVWVLAALALVVRELIPVETISTWSERLVGVILIAIGAWAIRRAVLLGRPDRPHTRHLHAALGVGALHGLAGTSHLLGVLPALALPTRADAAIYLASFGLGSVAAMTAFAGVLGAISTRTASMGTRWLQAFIMVAALAAIAIGVWWLTATF